MSEQETRRYGTVEGVFVPTLLTILGVILFLRLGWVVGNAGLLGSIAVILLAFTITGCTALSVASVSTNVAPPAGGAYPLVAREFGVEAGGAVGIPLYLSQTLVIVLYTFGFRDGWLSIFPGHPAVAVDIAVFVALVAITLISTKAAFRAQFVILAVVAGGLTAVAVALFTGPLDQIPPLIGAFPGAPEQGLRGTDFWSVFAVFFPATTGIMAGLNMSGELREPRRSIPRGTLAAVLVSTVVYLATAVWLAFAVPVDALVSNYFAVADYSAWAPAVLAGLLAATFSSALASLVGAPRILQALAEHDLPPASGWLSRRDGSGEPRNALLVTLAVVAAALLLRELNAIAPVITLVFLATYASINFSALVESLVALPSYRPSFRVPRLVPLVGGIGSLVAMFVVDALFAIVAVVAMAGVLVWLTRRRLDRPFSDIRSSALTALARWAMRKAAEVGTSEERSWTPQVLAPVADAADVERAATLLGHISDASGAVRLVVVGNEQARRGLRDSAGRTVEDLERRGMEAVLEEQETEDGAWPPAVALQEAVGDQTWSPNIVIAPFPDDASQDARARTLLRRAHHRRVGVVLVPAEIPATVDGCVGLWVGKPDPDWQSASHLPHSDLALLLAYRLSNNLDADLALLTAGVDGAGEAEDVEGYLRQVVDRARLPAQTAIHVIRRPFLEAVTASPPVGLHVLALSVQTDFERMRAVRDNAGAACLFVRDSGVENAFA